MRLRQGKLILGFTIGSSGCSAYVNPHTQLRADHPARHRALVARVECSINGRNVRVSAIGVIACENETYGRFTVCIAKEIMSIILI
jgi:hypothetical protein